MYFFFFLKKNILISKYILYTSKTFYLNSYLSIIYENPNKKKNDLIINDYFLDNFINIKKKNNSWNIKKGSINVPFKNTFWNNEFSFAKKKMLWEIKNKKKEF